MAAELGWASTSCAACTAPSRCSARRAACPVRRATSWRARSGAGSARRLRGHHRRRSGRDGGGQPRRPRGPRAVDRATSTCLRVTATPHVARPARWTSTTSSRARSCSCATPSRSSCCPAASARSTSSSRRCASSRPGSPAFPDHPRRLRLLVRPHRLAARHRDRRGHDLRWGRPRAAAGHRRPRPRRRYGGGGGMHRFGERAAVRQGVCPAQASRGPRRPQSPSFSAGQVRRTGCGAHQPLFIAPAAPEPPSRPRLPPPWIPRRDLQRPRARPPRAAFTTSTGPSSRSSTCPSRQGRAVRPLLALPGDASPTVPRRVRRFAWRRRRPARRRTTTTRVPARPTSTSGSSSATATTRSPNSAAPTSPADGHPTFLTERVSQRPRRGAPTSGQIPRASSPLTPRSRARSQASYYHDDQGSGRSTSSRWTTSSASSPRRCRACRRRHRTPVQPQRQA